jgi:hypothetical protein
MLRTTPVGNSNRNGSSSLVSPLLGNGTAFTPEFVPTADFSSSLAQRHELSSVAPLLVSCRSAVQHAVEHFKARKSSFLSHLTNRSILLVGVVPVPVTAVATEIRFGPVKKALAHFVDEGQLYCQPHCGDRGRLNKDWVGMPNRLRRQFQRASAYRRGIRIGGQVRREASLSSVRLAGRERDDFLTRAGAVYAVGVMSHCLPRELGTCQQVQYTACGRFAYELREPQRVPSPCGTNWRI